MFQAAPKLPALCFRFLFSTSLFPKLHPACTPLPLSPVHYPVPPFFLTDDIMRPLTDDESKLVFTKLANFIV
jgi:hypothetical protein